MQRKQGGREGKRKERINKEWKKGKKEDGRIEARKKGRKMKAVGN